MFDCRPIPRFDVLFPNERELSRVFNEVLLNELYIEFSLTVKILNYGYQIREATNENLTYF